ncbi:hypothetical protein BH24ACT22_BH24ACT22_19220 [soil metagenome]
MIRNSDSEETAEGSGTGKTTGGSGGRNHNLLRLVGIGLALLTVIFIAQLTGLTEYVSLENLGRLRDWINGFGVLAPLVFVAIYVAADDAFDADPVVNADCVDLGLLKGNQGNQTYELPPDVDPEVHRAVSIWCQQFAANFVTAPLGSV